MCLLWGWGERDANSWSRLKATGVMDVQNPVEAAYREGRIQELKDDEE
jgi:hypothetical protein